LRDRVVVVAPLFSRDDKDETDDDVRDENIIG
jgi:hypothetical protein